MNKKKCFVAIALSAVLLAVLVWNNKPEDKTYTAHTAYQRDAVEKQYTWNLADIYPQDKAWNNDYIKLKTNFLQIEKFKGTLADKQQILRCLKSREDTLRRLEKLYLYARLKSDQNQKDNEAVTMLSQVESLSAEIMAASAFIEPELLKLPEKSLKQYATSEELKIYDNYFALLIKKKQHLLSEAEERLIGLSLELAFTPKNIYDKLTLADMKFPVIKDAHGKDVQLSAANYHKYLTNNDRDFRKRAYEGVYAAYQDEKYTLAAALGSQVKKDLFYARVRKYDSPLGAALDSENVPTAMYTNLINTVNSKLNYLHRYVTLKKRVLKLDKMEEYDMFVPLVKDYYGEINYSHASKRVVEGLSVLGSEYTNILARAFKERWIDVYQTENKYSGNYNTGAYDTHPYILLNFSNDFESMFTLSHELGHAVHTYYSNRSQPYVDANVSILTSEVASATNELLLADYFIKNSQNRKEKIFLLNKLLENIRGSVFTQVMFAEFEQSIHERAERGEALNLDVLNELWHDLRTKYYGTDMRINKQADIGWARIPHFYMDFYVYKYAVSMAGANVISKDIIAKEPGARENYMEFLKAGSCDDPLNLLKKIKIDLRSPEAIQEILVYFNSLVSELELQLGEEGII